MPEGDTIFRAARTLHRALAGQPVVRFETGLAPLAAIDRASPIAGRTVTGVASRGKHLLVSLTGDLVLRTHLRMHGSWHVYRPGERWRVDRRRVRIVVETASWIAIAVDVIDAEFVAAPALARHATLSALGPDVLDASFDAAEARARIHARPDDEIAPALLRQTSLAGLGNVFKSELLFLQRLHPSTRVGDLQDGEIDALIARARALLALNVRETSIAASGGGRVTSGRLSPRERLYVYGRAGRPCLRCGAPIATSMAMDGRRTYWCPVCQAPRRGRE